MAYQQIMRGHVAGVGRNPTANMPPAASLGEEMKAEKSDVTTKVLGGTSMVAGFFSAPGAIVSTVAGRLKNSREEKNQLKVMARHLAPQVRVVLGLSKNHKVTESDLVAAAQLNNELHQAIKPVQTERARSNKLDMAENVATGLLPPGASGFAKVALHVGTGYATRTVVEKIDARHDIYTTHEAWKHLDAKLKSDQPVTPADVMLLRLAQNPAWQKEFKKRHHKGFHQLSDEEKFEVVQTMSDMLIKEQKTAYALNNNLITVQSLMTQGPESDSDFSGTLLRQRQEDIGITRQQAEIAVRQQQGLPFAEQERMRREIAEQAVNSGRLN